MIIILIIGSHVLGLRVFQYWIFVLEDFNQEDYQEWGKVEVDHHVQNLHQSVKHEHWVQESFLRASEFVMPSQFEIE